MRPFTHAGPPPKMRVTNKGWAYEYVTRVLSLVSEEGIKKWKADLCAEHGEEKGLEEADRISTNSINVGRAFHTMVENHLKNGDVRAPNEELEADPIELLEAARPYLGRIDNIIGQEISLVSDEMQVVGRADCVAEYLGQRAIIDFKQSRYPRPRDIAIKHLLQTACYSIMWEENTGERIDELVVITANWDGTVDVDRGHRDDHEERFRKVLDEWKKRKK